VIAACLVPSSKRQLLTDIYVQGDYEGASSPTLHRIQNPVGASECFWYVLEDLM